MLSSEFVLPCLILCFLGPSKLVQIPKFNFSVQLNQIPVCMYHTFIIQSPVDRHSGWLQVFPIVIWAATNMDGRVSLW